MSNERFDRIENLLEQLIRAVGNVGAELEEVKTNMATKEELVEVKNDLTDISSRLLRIENDHGTKLAALSDGYQLRGDENNQLTEHLDERLDSIQTDLSYLVSKVAQHDRNIVQLKKLAK